MATVILKTEPGTYSFEDLVRDGRTTWDGVSNPVALKNLRALKPGDEAMIYHTGDVKAIVGLARVDSAPREDPKDRGRTDAGEIKSPVVDLVPLRAAKTPATLAAIKGDARFKEFALVRQSRLSVVVVPPDLDGLLRRMAGL